MDTKKIFLVLLILLVSFYAFSQSIAEEKTSGFSSVTVVDQAGNTVEITKEPQRIVSGYYISSSACLALGLEEKIVAVEANADQRPVYSLSAPELIDYEDVGTAKAFKIEACIAANPDLVILPMKQKQTAKTLNEMGIPAIVVNPESHDQIKEMFLLIGQATGTVLEAENLISWYDRILNIVQTKTKDINSDDRPVVYLCKTGSYMTTFPSGMYQAELIEAAGGKNAGSCVSGVSTVEVSYEQFLSMNPDIIIIPTNSNANGTPKYSADDILNDSMLSEVKAVKNGAVYQMPVGFESWDSPVPSGALGVLWMLHTIHPQMVSSEEFCKEVKDFYKTYYGFEAEISI